MNSDQTFALNNKNNSLLGETFQTLADIADRKLQQTQAQITKMPRRYTSSFLITG